MTTDLGPVTAYAAAVAAGYTGTSEEFAAQQAEYAESAQKVAEDRVATEKAQEAAEENKKAAETSAREAGQILEAVQSAASQARESASGAANSAQEAGAAADRAEEYRRDVETAKKEVENAKNDVSEKQQRVSEDKNSVSSAASSVAADRSAVESLKQSVEQTVNDFDEHAVELEQGTIGTINDAADKAKEAGQSAVDAVGEAAAAALGNVETAKTNAVNAVDETKKLGIAAIEDNKESVLQAVEKARADAVSDVETTTVDGVAAVNAAAESGKEAFTTDDTLSITGRAADAKVTGDKIGKKADKDDAMSWSQWFDLHRTGWHGGVTFSQFDTSPSTLGTKTGDNAGTVIETSTNIKKGRNDFADKPVTNLLFNGIEVNGYIDQDGEPHITAVKGSPEFSRTGANGDVWMAYLTPYYKRISTDTEEGWDIADHKIDGLIPWPKSVRPDGSVRSFYFVAKYPGVIGDDGLIATISGKKPTRNASHNNQIADISKKGSQYCGMTSDDMAWAQMMCDMKFANHNSQAIMTGATGYYLQYPATVAEENVKRIIISKANAKNLLVGSYASIGYAGINNGALYLDRSTANIHKYADDVKILKIEDYDDNNSVVYVDAAEPFNTAAVKVNDSLTSPVYITTMHWWSGACDDVQGPDGSPSDCTSYKEPFILSGVEFGHGGYTVLADVIMDGVYNAESKAYTQTPYIVNDSRNIASKITENYTKCAMVVPGTNNNWEYISKEGYDPAFPWLQIPTAVGASSSTGFADGVHTGAFNTSLREVLWLGSLRSWSPAGLRCVGLDSGVDGTGWYILRRLSYLRRGVAAGGESA